MKALLPTQANFRNSIGLILLQQEKAWEALKELLYGFYIDASDPVLTFNLMDRLTAHGLYPLAIEVWIHHRRHRAEERDPGLDREIELFGQLATAVTIAGACAGFQKQLDTVNAKAPNLLDDLVPRERPWLSVPAKSIKVGTEALLDGKRVFISYRHADSAESAQRLQQKMKADQPSLVVFLDEAAMAGGEQWTERLRDEIKRADIVLLLIGHYWHNRPGLARLHRPGDVLRREIAFAIRESKPIIPVLAESAEMPDAKNLPEEIRAIAEYHAERLRLNDFETDWGRILKSMKRALTARVIEKAESARLWEKVGRLEKEDPDAWVKYIQKSLESIALDPKVKKYIPIKSKTNLGVSKDSVDDGVWECIAVGPGQKFSLRLVIGSLPGILFTGEMRIDDATGRVSRTHKIRGDCYPIYDSDTELQLGFLLKFIQDETTEARLTVPLHKRIGDAIVGTDSDGVKFTSRNVGPRVKGF
jgi:hypothetical protein